MSTEVNISNILKNIYGEQSTNSVKNISVGIQEFEKVKYKEPKLVYLDDPGTISDTKVETITEDEKEQIIGLAGGGRRKKRRGGGEQTTIYSSPMYVDESDLLLFVRTFNLAYTMVNARRSAIYVIPESKILKQMIADFEKISKKEGFNIGTIEASKYISTNALPFKRYIFDWKEKATDRVA
jgi:hypothetical protein